MYCSWVQRTGSFYATDHGAVTQLGASLAKLDVLKLESDISWDKHT
jgi:hypothetical protein